MSSDDPLAAPRGIRNALLIAIFLLWLPFLVGILWLAFQ